MNQNNYQLTDTFQGGDLHLEFGINKEVRGNGHPLLNDPLIQFLIYPKNDSKKAQIVTEVLASIPHNYLPVMFDLYVNQQNIGHNDASIIFSGDSVDFYMNETNTSIDKDSASRILDKYFTGYAKYVEGLEIPLPEWAKKYIEKVKMHYTV